MIEGITITICIILYSKQKIIMKNLFIVIVLLFYINVNAQSCLTEGIVFQSQVELNQFPSLYPFCQTIEGDVLIEDVSKFDSLFSVVSILGNLKIQLTNAADLDGLHNLTTVEGDVEIKYNSNLDDLTFSQLTTIGGDLIILNSSDLINLAGLENLVSVGGNLIIQNNNDLVNLVGLENLSSIGGDFIVKDNNDFIVPLATNNLTNIGGDLLLQSSSTEQMSGLENLNFVGGDFFIGANAVSGLIDFKGFENLDTIIGTITMDAFWHLESFQGFDNLKYIGGDLDFHGLNIDSLFLSDFPSLMEVGGDFNFKSSSFRSIKGFNTLEKIGGKLILNGLNNIRELSGFESLSVVDSAIIIEDCSHVRTIPGFNSLVHVGSLIIGNIVNTSSSGNEDLESIIGFENLLTVENDLLIRENSSLDTIIGFNAITHVGGDFGLARNTTGFQDSLNAFKAIEEIGGDFLLKKQSFDYPISFNFLTNVGGDLIVDAFRPPSLSFPTLERIEGSFLVDANIDSLSGLANLQYIGGDFSVEEIFTITYVAECPLLDTIGGDLIFKDNNNLQTISGFDQLSYIGGNLEISNNEDFSDTSLTSIPSFNALIHIGGFLGIHTNEDLLSINGFNSLVNVNNINIVANTNLNQINGFASLNLVNGSISVRNNPMLETFNCFQNLAQINGSLQFSSNYNVQDISSLSNLQSLDGALRIDRNYRLKSLVGLQNINPLSINEDNPSYLDLQITNNDSLSICSINSVCGVLSLPDVQVEIESNGEGCNSSEEIICIDYGLSGIVFYDQNQNGIKDGNDYGIGNRLIGFQSENVIRYTDEYGQYFNFADSGSVYTISYIEDPDWILTSDSISYTHSFEPGQTENLNNNFGIYPVLSEHSGRVSISSNPTRCNTDVEFFIKMKNEGTFYESGNLSFHLDPRCSFVEAIPPPNSIDLTTNTITWTRDSIAPFRAFEPSIVLEMPNETFTGDTLMFNSDWNSSNSSLSIDNNYQPEVRCAYDPNDKLAMPHGVYDENYALIKDTFEYTIRFQNTGNDVAFDVVILDTISTEFDITTFKILNNSHPVDVKRVDNVIEFSFNEIYLPDSLSNEPESHGFVSYSIVPKEDTPNNSLVENTAYIFFDFNPAIVTNTTSHTLVDSIPILTSLKEESVIGLSVYPSPTTGEFHIKGLENSLNRQLIVYNSFGQIIHVTNETSFDLSNHTTGIYWIRVIIDDRITTLNVVLSE